MLEHIQSPKIPRLNRPYSITEKIDGSNGQVRITDDGLVYVGSRNRWITPGKPPDNTGRWKGVPDWPEAKERGLDVVPVLARPRNLAELAHEVSFQCDKLANQG